MKNQLLNDSLNNRLYTLELNIKSKSNSFYDSFLDLLESTVKFILDDNKIDYDISRTCGFLVKNDLNVKSFFLDIVKVDSYTFDKLSDYIKKCNDSKHKKEKCASIEGIINFMKAYFDFYNYYLVYANEETISFDAEYYISIYGETEKEYQKLLNEKKSLSEEIKDLYDSNKLKDADLETYKSIINYKEKERTNLSEENIELEKQISKLKDIKLSTIEVKLNKTIDLLLELQDSIAENRVMTAVVGSSITGDYEKRVEKEKEKIKGNK